MNGYSKVCCSCCGKDVGYGEYVTLGNGINLCTSCSAVAKRGLELIHQDKEEQAAAFQHTEFKLLRPAQLKAEWDNYVIGQDKAKKILSVAVYNHYKRLQLNDKSIKKSNVLMIGPTGSGKTYLVQTMAKALNVPLAIADATSLTEAGYIGDDVESVCAKLINAADGDVGRAQKGIIFIDEIDKLSSVRSDTEKKVGGRGVQQSLLKLLEGSIIEVPIAGKGNATAGKEAKVSMDTSDILFICGGAFPELEKIIEKRMSKKSSMGFGSYIQEPRDETDPNILLNVTTEDLREFGMIPEFLGRLPIIAPLEALTVETLKRILAEPKDSLVSQYTKLFECDEVQLCFDDEALTLIAESAYEKKTGARSLRAIMEDLLLDLMFEVPEESELGSVTVTEGFVKGLEPPIKVYREAEKICMAATVAE